MRGLKRRRCATVGIKVVLSILAGCSGGSSSRISAAAATAGPAATAAITVDAAVNRHAINPMIYGINFGSAQTLLDLRVPLDRSGGDSASLYNWQLDARNAGRDWYFESLPVDVNDPNDQYGARFVTAAQAAGAAPILTIPMIGRIAKLGANNAKLASFSIAKYGAQVSNDVDGFPDAGNGILIGGTQITGNDPDDATMTDSTANEQARVAALVQQFGTGSAGGVRYYAMDNEPSVWQLIHFDVQPTGAHASDMAARVISYSQAVKAADSSAQILAPEEWGWNGYLYSGYDQQYSITHGYANAPDKTSQTGGMDYVPWLLSQWKAAGHPIDVFSLHFYPQSNEYQDTTGSEDIMLKRNVSTRDLWDQSYIDPTYINSVIALIPRMRNWVNTYYYSGTPIAITEYNWGGDTLMNGATAQADILGIFGREGLDMATRWGTIDSTMPVYKAIKLYRNYDGAGSAFGATSISTTVANPDNVSAFAAIRADNAVTLMVVNKQLSLPSTVTASLNNITSSGTAEVWQLANNAITRLSDLAYSSGQLSATLPQQSVTLFVVHNAVQ
ncbi:glycoside hydrolase family 44 protein [Robbsia andropogonis]|uniref:glycoside hydrolase family 44 protein n=1 Tax=Robbsia andropogonis TaxID=28092 RepID=UPI0004651DA6|nr:glycoside hydrolase family 44 protein [Robbsia andropogonis]